MGGMQASVTVPGRHVKLFSKALSAIAKIGSELVLELADGVRRGGAEWLGAPGSEREGQGAFPLSVFFFFPLFRAV